MKSHDLDVVSLIFGVLFAGLAIIYTIGAYADFTLNPRYVVPGILVGLGVAGLLGSIAAQRRTDRRAAVGTDGLDTD